MIISTATQRDSSDAIIPIEVECVFIDIDTLSIRLGVPKKTIYKWTSESNINDFPYYRIGRYCKFIWKEVEAWYRKYHGSLGTKKFMS